MLTIMHDCKHLCQTICSNDTAIISQQYQHETYCMCSDVIQNKSSQYILAAFMLKYVAVPLLLHGVLALHIFNEQIVSILESSLCLKCNLMLATASIQLTEINKPLKHPDIEPCRNYCIKLKIKCTKKKKSHKSLKCAKNLQKQKQERYSPADQEIKQFHNCQFQNEHTFNTTPGQTLSRAQSRAHSQCS